MGITVEQFMDSFLEKVKLGIGYHTKHKPCDFLQEDGNCKLGDCKPDSCKKYPYTDQPERLSNLLGMLVDRRVDKELDFLMKRRKNWMNL